MARGRIEMSYTYFDAKADGFKYVTRDLVGGECVHKTKPKRKNKYWFSYGWKYIQDGNMCPDKTTIMGINAAIRRYKLAVKRRTIKVESDSKIKRCEWCEEVFEPKRGNQKYCCELCQKKASKWREWERIKNS